MALATGLVDLTGGGSCSRYDLALATLKLRATEWPEIWRWSRSQPTPSPSRRAALGAVMDCSRVAALGVALPEWRDELGRFVPELSGSEPRLFE